MGAQTHSAVVAAEAHAAFLLLQRRVRSVHFRLPAPVKVQANLVLMLISGGHIRLASELAGQLGKDRSRISVILRDLKAANILREDRDPNDGRRKTISLTLQGEQLNRQLTFLGNHVAKVAIFSAGQPFVEIVQNFLQKLASGLGITHLVPQPGEHPFVSLQNEVARRTGLLTNNYMGERFSITEYQVLFELWRNAEPLPLKELIARIGWDSESLVSVVRELGRQRFVSKQRALPDARQITISLSRLGRDAFERVHQAIGERLSHLLREMSADEAGNFIQAAHTICELPIVNVDRGLVEAQVVREESDFYGARKFLVEQLVLNKLHRQLPPILIGEAEPVYIVRILGEVFGLVVVEQNTEQALKVRYCLFDTQSQYSSTLQLEAYGRLFRLLAEHKHSWNLVIKRNGSSLDPTQLALGVVPWKITFAPD